MTPSDRILALLDARLEREFLPGVFGILNITPDSFSDGGAYRDPDRAVAHAHELFRNGADALDVGAESTRPGAAEVSVSEEIDRLMPVLRRIREAFPDRVISVDTRKAEVAEAVLSEDCADYINDVSAFQFDPAMAGVVSRHHAGAILMHARGTPQTMQSSENLHYVNCAEEVACFLAEARLRAVKEGIAPELILLDPGIGFAKTPEQNLELLRVPDCLKNLNASLFYGFSRKSFIQRVCGFEISPCERDYASAALIPGLAARGVMFLRMHNVSAARQALCMFRAMGGVFSGKKTNFC